MEAGKVRWVWTTNFDDLVDKSRVADRKRPFLQAGMDSSSRVSVAPDGEEVVQVFLHGDYRYDPLRNTADELRALDEELRSKLSELVQSYPLVIIGYSGRDESVMSTLREAYSRKAQDLYWCLLEGVPIPAEVRELLGVAERAGNYASIVTYDGFDDLMVRLGRMWLPDSASQSAIQSILATRETVGRFRLPDGVAPDADWILGNALEIELPRTVFEIREAVIPKEGAWRWLREKTVGTGVSAGLFKGSILAIGERSSIAQVFGVPSTKVREITMRDDDLATNAALQGALLSGLVEGVRGSFERVGRYEIAGSKVLTVVYEGAPYRYRQSLRLSLQRAAGKSYLALEPNVSIIDELDDDTRKAVTREILWKQRNYEYFNQLKEWKAQLFPTDSSYVVRFPSASSGGAEFRVNKKGPIVARLHSYRPRPADPQLDRQFRKLERFGAITVSEPYLRFANSKAIHPIRGLATAGGPVDANDPAQINSAAIRVGVICSSGYGQGLVRFLGTLTTIQRVSGFDQDREYLVDYPGFSAAYKTALTFPTAPSDGRWRTIQRAGGVASMDLFRQVVDSVRRAVDELQAAGGADVVIIHVPPEWSAIERLEVKGETYNLHDHIKAVCIQRGVRSQLLRETKIKPPFTARMSWWLSLAIFTKAMRTPWALDRSTKDVAFVGIGYSYSAEDKQDPVVLGCSHVFDANGLGLRFRLSNLNAPIWVPDLTFGGRRNPHMSRDDAARLGNRTRQLFYEIHQTLPKRVLVAKRTPFLQTETEGLLNALNDVPEVDLVTIRFDDSWRFCAYNPRKKQAHGFPVRRGTALVLNDNEALVWLHGSVMEVVPAGTYFQGKSRIPVPVRVTRYSGDTNIESLTSDLVALTKMDWNTFALYRKLPVTVTTPNVIARIGRLLPTVTAESYDYRLFM